jgi:hypothetical protein
MFLLRFSHFYLNYVPYFGGGGDYSASFICNHIFYFPLFQLFLTFFLIFLHMPSVNISSGENDKYISGYFLLEN